VIRVELDPDRKRGSAEDIRSATAAILPPGDAAGASQQKLSLSWVGEDTLEARFPIQKAGMYLGAVDVGRDKVLPLAPLSLPYSPEFEPRQDPAEGRKTLEEIARLTGGIERTSWNDVFSASGLRDRQVRELVIPVALMLLLLHVTEIAGRRLFLFAAASARLRALRLPRLRMPARPRPKVTPAPAAGEAQQPKPIEPLKPVKPSTSPLQRAKSKARDRM